MKLNKKQVAPILSLVGANDYRGRRFTLEVAADYFLNNGDLVWDGGSKLEVTFLRNVEGTLEMVDAEQAMRNPITSGPQELRSAIPQNVMIVERSFFCGKDMGFRFIVAPQSSFLPPTLQEPQILGLLAAK